jgi:hypothetical protein
VSDIEDILNEEAEKRRARLQAMAEELRATEMADSVVIITTYTSNGYTQWTSGIAGNSFACTASAEKYVQDKKEEWGR